MASYRIEWKSSAGKELKKLPGDQVLRIVEAVGQLAENPFPQGCRKLHGSEATYRIRVGDYRVIFGVDAHRHEIEIIRVRHRKDAYR